MNPRLSDEVVDLSEKIYRYAELGSEEFRSVKAITEMLSRYGFRVEAPYKEIETAFHAVKGQGKVAVGFLCEYDALPNGHSCGHNLIAAWSVGAAIMLAEAASDVRVEVFGTPSEEGIGKYAGGKVLLAKRGAFTTVDFMVGMHPSDEWCVGTTALSDITYRFTFRGRSAHGAASPEAGNNALDAAVSSYVGINSLRGASRPSNNLVVGMVFREGGRATNVIPDRAVLDVEIRSTSAPFLRTFGERVKKLVEGIASAYGCTVDGEEITPLYESYLNNSVINRVLRKYLEALGYTVREVDEGEVPSGSTDEANVSRIVPTGHIDVGIAPLGTPGHSDDFRDYSDPRKSRKALMDSIEATVRACLEIVSRRELIDEIKEEFRRRSE